MSNIPDDASSMSDDVFEDPETTQRRVDEKRRQQELAEQQAAQERQKKRHDQHQHQHQHQSQFKFNEYDYNYAGSRSAPFESIDAATGPVQPRIPSSSGYPGYRPPREALQLYALEDASYRLNNNYSNDDDEYDDGWRSYRYEEVGMVYPTHHQHPQPFDDTVNHKTILLGDSGVGKTSFLVKYNTGEFRLGSFSATVGIALTVLILGDAGVGKSPFLTKFAFNRSPYRFYDPTFGLDFCNKIVVIDGTRVKLQIWDTAGQERFRSVTHAYYRDAHALLLLYDITNRNTFDNIRAWLGEIREYAQDDVVIVLIGNKADCSNSERQVKREDGDRLANEHNVPFMEASAKTGQNVELAFVAIARQLKSRGHDHEGDGRFNVHEFVRDHTQARSVCAQCKFN